MREQENVKDDKHFSFLIPKVSSKKYLMISSTTINIEGIGPVLLERSARAKRLNITIKPFKGVRVAVPTGVPFKVAEKLTRAKSKWLTHHIPRIKDLNTLTPPELDMLRKRYWALAEKMVGPIEAGKRLLDKLPFNIIDLGMIYRLFSDAKVIVVLRDSRDCCLSCFMQPFTRSQTNMH